MTRIVQKVLVLVMLFALVGMMMWSRNKSRGELCTDLVVEIANADSSAFVTSAGVKTQLEKSGIKTISLPMGEINTDKIETELERSEYLERAECTKCPGGVLLVRATQIVPVLRVFDGDRSYYINRAGKQMDATSAYHVDVPVVEGHFTPRYPATRILPLVNIIADDATLNELVAMYVMVDSNNVYIVPRINGHIVNVGNMDNLAGKMDKLKLFYSEVLPKVGWEKYDTISLKWDYRVVATRREKTKKIELDYNSIYDEPPADLQTMSIDMPADTTKKPTTDNPTNN